MSAAWSLPGRFGPERWQPVGDKLVAVEIDAAAVSDPSDAALLDRIGARDTVCGHPGPLPNAFRFCPGCGASLRPEPPADRALPWSPPFGGSDGLPERHGVGWPDPDSREEIAMPASASIGLAVAGTPSRLLCCDRASGWVSAFSERDCGWHRLVRVPGCAELPRWRWSAVATDAGLALPTERGPVWIDLSPAIGATVITAAEQTVPIGGAARIGDTVLMPVRHDGVLAIAALRLAGEAGWVLHPVANAQAAAADTLASPVVGSDTAFWCGAGAQLAVRDTADGLDARAVAWTDGVTPLRGALPVVGRDGTLHLPCRLDQTTLVHEALLVPGQPRGRRIARGYTPGTGRAVFRENTRLRLPWDERAACDYPLADDRFLYPLLDLGDDRFLLAVCTDRSRMGAFLGDPLFADDVDAAPLFCTLMYSRGPRMLEPLDCVLRAHRASDLSVAVHGQWLLVHGAPENRCHRWMLRDAD